MVKITCFNMEWVFVVEVEWTNHIKEKYKEF